MKKILMVLFLFIMPINVWADTAKSSIVMDMDSNRILYENNIHDRRLIASITKIMTAIVAIENGNLDKEFIAKDEILKMYGTSIYLEYNEKMKLRDLLYGLMLRSGNDAASVIAKNITGSQEEFVKLMNDKAKEIGMINTVFNNPHGLDDFKDKNYSTSYDMALLTSYAYKNKVYRKIAETKKYQVKTKNKSYLWYNRNKLLGNYKYCTGGKNGYTPSAGKTLVTTSSFNNLNIVVVSLNDPNEYVNHENLAEMIFSKYKNYQLVDKNDFNSEHYYIKKNFSYPLTAKEKENTKVLVNIDSSLKNSQVGNIKVLVNNKEIKKIPIYYKDTKKKTNFLTNLFS